MSKLPPAFAELLTAAEKLANSVSFDMNGEIIGGKLTGGHGGLISNDTLKAADEVRRICHALGVAKS
ncbi:hypothetical protein MPL3356_60532 [Mesorhizobium plurifarium]|uniref:Uncharacterized protein n=1 Tax=Mesorhizobium plurifarium TaxID=69974 RepID=A0A090E9Z4_MESPL|nr:hypothetical protein MPL3356_60532 [Mesorhizobium plurifarium]